MGVEIFLSEYRHLAQIIMEEISVNDQKSRNIWALQAGHSIEVATTLYAISEEQIYSSSRDTIDFFKRVSVSWQEYLGLRSAPLSSSKPTELEIGKATETNAAIVLAIESMKVELKQAIKGIQNSRPGSQHTTAIDNTAGINHILI